MVHEHHTIRVTDPVNNHEWEICECGFAVDIHVMRGNLT